MLRFGTRPSRYWIELSAIFTPTRRMSEGTLLPEPETGGTAVMLSTLPMPTRSAPGLAGTITVPPAAALGTTATVGALGAVTIAGAGAGAITTRAGAGVTGSLVVQAPRNAKAMGVRTNAVFFMRVSCKRHGDAAILVP